MRYGGDRLAKTRMDPSSPRRRRRRPRPEPEQGARPEMAGPLLHRRDPPLRRPGRAGADPGAGHDGHRRGRGSGAVPRDPERDGRFSSYVGAQVRQRIREALAEYNDTSRSAEKLARGINRLNEISGTFAKENGREATLQELSSLMGMSEDEVRTLMKESLNAINYNPA